jgi:hypothetical protein
METAGFTLWEAGRDTAENNHISRGVHLPECFRLWGQRVVASRDYLLGPLSQAIVGLAQD